MKRSVLTVLALPAVIAVALGGTALSAPSASAAPASAAPASAEASLVESPVEAPADAPIETTPADGTAAAETTPTDGTAATETPASGAAPAQAAAQDDTPSAPSALETETGTDDLVGIAAATEPGTVTISGATEIGDVQTVVTEGWPDGTTYTYQWTRDGEAVAGATGETYVLVRADAGRVVEVVVTGTGPAADDEPTTVTSDRRVAAGVAPVFTSQPGSDLSVVAGQPFSFTWTATGDPTPGVYVVADPSTLVVSLPDEAVVTSAAGSGRLTIAGTPTSVGVHSFGVTAINPVGIGELLVVDLEVVPAAPAGIVASAGELTDGVVAGDIAFSSSLDGNATTLSLDDGDTAAVGAYLVDAFENVIPIEDYPTGTDRAVVTSSGRGDVIRVPEDGVAEATFHGAGSRALTVTLAGFSATVPVEVRAAAAAVPAGTDARPVSVTGQLAYTGADGTGTLLALAGGLVSVGAALIVVRLRRRVQH
jgi:hypothetical protein